MNRVIYRDCLSSCLFYTVTELAMSSEQLERTKAKRAGHRGIVTKLVKEAAPLFLEGSERALNRLRTINRQLDDKLTLLQDLDGEILELVPVGEVEDEIMEAGVISSKIVDLREQIADFMAKSRTSETAPKMTLEPIMDEHVDEHVVCQQRVLRE